MAKPGDKCSCGGTFNVYSCRSSENYSVRYLKCSKCSKTDKQIVPAEFIRRRVRVA